MKNRKLASRYARALLDALPPDSLEGADNLLQVLAETMRTTDELRDLLLDPAVPRATKESVLSSVVRAFPGIPEAAQRLIRNFFRTVLQNGRAGDLPVIAAVFHEMRQERMRIVSATIRTPGPMDEDLKLKARQALERMTKRNVHLEYEVEPELLGGAVTQIGSTIYDGSLRTQLSRLRKRMAEE